MSEKLKLLDKYCTTSGMHLNESKTKLMVINGSPIDKVPFVSSTVVIKHCDRYIYLGVIFTADGRGTTSLQQHLNDKNREVNKLFIFLAVNYDAPFQVKKRVLEAAFLSSILYGCESWLGVPLKPVKVIYMKAVRALLGVRSTTPTDLCLLEGGLKSLDSLVKTRQKKFFTKMHEARSEMADDPLMHALHITKELHKPLWSYIESTMNGGNFIVDQLNLLKESIRNARPSATRFHVYRSLNPFFEVHHLYTNKNYSIPDYLRISFTRYRLSSHMLRVETGRWSRTPRSERICPCGTGIQDEFHIFTCPLVKEHFNSLSKPCCSPAELFIDTTLEALQALNKVLNSLTEANTLST